MPLTEKDLNKKGDVIFSDPNELKIPGLKTYESKINASKSNKRRRAKRTLNSIPEISSSNRCKSWLDLYDDEKSDEDVTSNNENILIKLENSRVSNKKTSTQTRDDENEIAKKVVQEHIAKRPKLSKIQSESENEIVSQSVSLFTKSSIIISKKTNEKLPATATKQDHPSDKSGSPRNSVDNAKPEEEICFEIFEPNWITKRPDKKTSKKEIFSRELDAPQENKDAVYDDNYGPESKPAKSLIKRMKTTTRKTTAPRKKTVKKPNQYLSDADLAAKEKWERECKEIANYKLIVETVDHDF